MNTTSPDGGLGNRIAQSPGINRGAPLFAEKTVARYPSGSTVDVRFNPKRPSESVLEPRVPAGWILVALISGFRARGSHLRERDMNRRHRPRSPCKMAERPNLAANTGGPASGAYALTAGRGFLRPSGV